MFDRLLEVDETNREQHHHLTKDDVCYHLGEYRQRAGYSFSKTNSLISNLKKTLDKKGQRGWSYKEKAIDTVAGNLRAILGKKAIEKWTFVPAPPSKIKTDPLYDDRLVKILQKMGAGYNIDIREMIYHLSSKEPDHTSDNRQSLSDLEANMRLDRSLLAPSPTNIIIFDDVLTTGAHFVVIKKLLKAQFPAARIIGLFVARRTFMTVEEMFSQVL